MGGGSSKEKAVTTPAPISTAVTVHTTVYTTMTTADFKASEVKCWIDNHEILYISLVFLSGVLLTVLVFAVICLCRKKCKRSHHSSEEQSPSQTVTEESANNTQSEVAYTSLVFRKSSTLMAV
ncbi:transmembrane protein C1orf162 homolog [Cuculus canorus]|uniref:transmembrane protein C1orf162 homolog n=1 Tax=Cuculus canorus TaxID=55661 RepID=UPI0023AAB48C|nr:transmembrane protein C1orf162 homolog [Cuculus canorus]XP_053943241.1 transmembrane protein C1orf162 homolog [Cuculus canorus]XP_053943242.1 transmembrane protein C1orf162 homolog [Cuculus canorus]